MDKAPCGKQSMGQVHFVTLPKCQMEDLSTKLTNNVVERLRHRQVNKPQSIGTPLSKTNYQCSVYQIGHCSKNLQHQPTWLFENVCVLQHHRVLSWALHENIVATHPGPRPTGSCAHPVHSAAKRQLTWCCFGRTKPFHKNMKYNEVRNAS